MQEAPRRERLYPPRKGRAAGLSNQKESKEG